MRLPRHDPFSRKTGFSLVEVIVVIAITGVLAVLLVPMAGKLRQTGDKAACVSNMRSVGLGLISYAQDNNGLLPLSMNPDPLDTAAQVSWQTLIQRQLGVSFPRPGQRTVFACPAAKETFPQLPYRTYGLNLAGGSPTADPPRLNVLTSPGQSILLVETRHEAGGAGYNALSGSVAGVGGKGRLENRHSGQMNMVMADGSLRYLPANDPEIDTLLLNIRK